MKKKIFILLSVSSLVLSSCQEDAIMVVNDIEQESGLDKNKDKAVSLPD